MKKNIIVLSLLLMLSFEAKCWENLSDNWIIVDSTSYLRYICLECADSNNCIAMGERYGPEPHIKRTTDGGSTWNTIYSDTIEAERWDNGIPINISYYPKYKFFDIAYPALDFIVGVTNKNKIAISRDFGKTFELSNPANSVKLKTIKMFNSRIGYYTDIESNIYRTEDSCKTWQLIILPDTIKYSIYDYVLPDSTSVCLYMSQNKFITSNDNGNNWNIYSWPEYCHSVYFWDKNNGWAGGGKLHDSLNTLYSNRIYKTTNGGRSWELQFDVYRQSSGLIVDIDFYDSKTGIAIGLLETVLKTENSGGDWQFDFPFKNYDHIISNLGKVKWNKYNSQIILGSHDVIYKYFANPPISVPLNLNYRATPLVTPNPARDYIYINSNEDLSFLSIYNALGICVYSSSPHDALSGKEEELRIDVSGLPSGLYFLRSSSGTVSRTGKFVIAR